MCGFWLCLCKSYDRNIHTSSIGFLFGAFFTVYLYILRCWVICDCFKRNKKQTHADDGKVKKEEIKQKLKKSKIKTVHVKEKTKWQSYYLYGVFFHSFLLRSFVFLIVLFCIPLFNHRCQCEWMEMYYITLTACMKWNEIRFIYTNRLCITLNDGSKPIGMNEKRGTRANWFLAANSDWM